MVLTPNLCTIFIADHQSNIREFLGKFLWRTKQLIDLCLQFAQLLITTEIGLGKNMVEIAMLVKFGCDGERSVYMVSLDVCRLDDRRIIEAASRNCCRP